MKIIEDQQEVFNSLNELVEKYEEPDSSYKLHEVESKFIEGMSRGIVAFKINISKIEAKAKLSQNHPVERQELVINKLETSHDQENKQIAALMKEKLQKRK